MFLSSASSQHYQVNKMMDPVLSGESFHLTFTSSLLITSLTSSQNPICHARFQAGISPALSFYSWHRSYFMEFLFILTQLLSEYCFVWYFYFKQKLWYIFYFFASFALFLRLRLIETVPFKRISGAS